MIQALLYNVEIWTINKVVLRLWKCGCIEEQVTFIENKNKDPTNVETEKKDNDLEIKI